MEITSSVSLSYFFYSCLSGVIMALIYDVIKALRSVGNGSVVGICLWDIAFIMFWGFGVFYTAFNKNNGALRWQGFIGSIGCFFLYRLIIGDKFLKIILAVKKLLKKAIGLILKIVLSPAFFAVKILKKPIKSAKKSVGKASFRLTRILRVKKEQKRLRKSVKSKLRRTEKHNKREGG